MNNLQINLKNGMGDKLLDLLGFYVICKYLNYRPNFNLNASHVNFGWGSNNYEPRLFHFNDLVINNGNCEYYIESPCPSSSLSPYKVFTFLKDFIPEITFEEVSSRFKIYAKEIIKPSDIILLKIPYGLENAYGIHLRKSDKVEQIACGHQCSSSYKEFVIITEKVLEDVKHIISNEEDPIFLVVSEDENWKNKIKDIIRNIDENKKAKFVELDYANENDYDNYKSVLDMFCLSKCKTIIQGVKYSTFSMLASILGNCKLVNYSNFLENNNRWLIHDWSSVIEINNESIIDIDRIKEVCDTFPGINTNISSIWPI